MYFHRRAQNIGAVTALRRYPFLIAAFALLLAGCGKDYLAEKAFYNANKVLASVEASDSDAWNEAAYDKVASAFNFVAETYPASPKAVESLFLIAKLRMQQGHLEDAREALVRIIQDVASTEEAIGQARFGLARLFEQEGLWDKAESTLWETADRHPLSSQGLYAPLHVILHYKKSEDEAARSEAYQKARTHYEKLLSDLGPVQRSAHIHHYVALAHWFSGQHEEAKKTWFALAADFPDSPYAPVSLLSAAELAWKDGAIEESRELYEAYFKQFDSDALQPQAALSYGILNTQQKDFSAGRAWLERALAGIDENAESGLRDKAVEIRILIAKNYQDEGLTEEADHRFREIESRYPDNAATLQIPFIEAEYLFDLGETEQANERLDRALVRCRAFEEAHAGEPSSERARYLINLALARKGEWEQVVENVGRDWANETDPAKKGNWLYLKGLLAERRLGDSEQARAIFSDFLSQYPNHSLRASAEQHYDSLAPAKA